MTCDTLLTDKTFMEKYIKILSTMYKHLVQIKNALKSATESATKSAQQLCCSFDKAICVNQVNEISLIIAWILN